MSACGEEGGSKLEQIVVFTFNEKGTQICSSQLPKLLLSKPIELVQGNCRYLRVSKPWFYAILNAVQELKYIHILLLDINENTPLVQGPIL